MTHVGKVGHRAKLTEALELIQSVASELNTQGEPCPTCERFKLRNWNEAQLFNILDGMSIKLQNLLKSEVPETL